MTQKLWLKKLKLKYPKEVLDIVQFGSSVIEGKTANDLDIAVIFQKISIKEQLNISQKIKKQLETFSEISIHITSFDLYSFFNESNFAKEGILFYGRSIIYGDSFSKRFGLNSKIQIFYSLIKLKKKDKIRFNYALNGKQGEYGLLKKYSCKLLKPGLIEISPEYEKIFSDTIKGFNVDFEIKKILY